MVVEGSTYDFASSKKIKVSHVLSEKTCEIVCSDFGGDVFADIVETDHGYENCGKLADGEVDKIQRQSSYLMHKVCTRDSA